MPEYACNTVLVSNNLRLLNFQIFKQILDDPES